MNKALKIRRTDIWLMVTFPLTAISGVMIHVANHNPSEMQIQPWLGLHILAAILFLFFAIKHIYLHWRWFKSMFTGFKKRSVITLLAALSFLFVSITGLILVIGKSGGGSHLSLAHYQFGLLFIVFATWHCLKRLKVFRKLKG